MPRIRILLLEDSPLDADLARVRLLKGGIDFEMERVDTRDAFLDRLESGRFDLILADYSLPSFDGLSALELAHARRPHLPFIFISGGLGEEMAIDTLKRGATDYVTKQQLDRLAPAVNRAMAEAQGRIERLRAEARLRESEERHRLILESVTDYAIITLDLDGRITSWNKGAERVFGHRESEVLGTSGTSLFTPDEVAGGVPLAELSLAARSGRAESERWHIRKGGERFWGSGVVRPLLADAGGLQGYVKVVHDMTDRKRAEEALREADRRKDDFLAMLAHELRNPLSTINNAVQLARRSGKAEHMEWAKDVIGQQVKNLSRMIDDLLDVSRITRGKMQLRTERQDPARIIHVAVEAVRPLIESRRHHLSVTVAPTTPQVAADATRLEQILANLLTNAAKYTEIGGRIALSARPDGGDLVIKVRDSGAGLSPEMLAKVFEPFVQVEQTIDRSQGGLGIGLTLARRLAEMHGGSLTAASPGLGLGSEFVLRLPAIAEVATPAEDPAHLPAPTADRTGPRVLIVDDNIESARGLAALLTTLGHDVRTAFDGIEAVEAARDHRPEVVLLDIGLPGLDGYQVASKIRGDRRLKGALLIAITGYGQDEDRRRSAEAGFDHHMVKPVDFDELLALLSGPEAAAATPGGR